MATSEINSELGNSLLLDDDEVSGYIFSHVKAAESNNLVEQSYSVHLVLNVLFWIWTCVEIL